MEQLNNNHLNDQLLISKPGEARESTTKSFIDANTVPATLEEIKSKHIIPVFAKDGHPVISHADFIDMAFDTISGYYSAEQVLPPSIRVSHPIQGRVPEARHKPYQYLEEKDKTIYYDRMMFVIEIPTITDVINGNSLSLTIGGVKAYNMDNLHSRKGSDEHFTLFIGFQNKVCTNLCVWSDGLKESVKVSSLAQLQGCLKTMMENYNAVYHLVSMSKLVDYSLSEHQFAHLLGRCRMYNHLPSSQKKELPKMLFGDTQMNVVAKDFYQDDSFCKDEKGDINLWRLYNLFTNANKMTYIDNFLQKGVNAFQLVEGLKEALDNKSSNWFLN